MSFNSVIDGHIGLREHSNLIGDCNRSLLRHCTPIQAANETRNLHIAYCACVDYLNFYIAASGYLHRLATIWREPGQMSSKPPFLAHLLLSIL